MTDEDQPTFAMTADRLVGRVLDGRFRIIHKLATGGMGRVYLAEQKGLERTVALKVLATDAGAAGAQFRERFFREAKLCSRLTHPNTVRIYDYGQTDDGIFYIAMEFLDGLTLSALTKQAGALDPLRVVNIATQVCGSLAEAHAIGLIHRDLKPDNLIVTRTADGREFVRVVDFGIAKDTNNTELPTEAGMVYGSPGYMSPEQILDQPLGPRSDIYSLGAILYRMATGVKPFGNTNAVALLSRHVYSPLQPFRTANPEAEIPGSLEWVTMTCLAKDPSDRFATSSEVSRALKVCELEARRLLTAPVLSLKEGRLVLSPEVEEGLMRFGGDISVITPSPIAVRSIDLSKDAASGGSEQSMRSGGYVAGDLPSGTVSLSRRLRSPVLLLIGGLVPLIAAATLLLLLGIVGWLSLLAWQADEPRAETVPVLELPTNPPPEVLPAALLQEPIAEDKPKSAPERGEPQTERSDQPTSHAKRRTTPAPVVPAPVVPAPVVPAPVVPVSVAPAPAPAPEPADPSHRSDLRNPFED